MHVTVDTRRCSTFWMLEPCIMSNTVSLVFLNPRSTPIMPVNTVLGCSTRHQGLKGRVKVAVLASGHRCLHK